MVRRPAYTHMGSLPLEQLKQHRRPSITCTWKGFSLKTCAIPDTVKTPESTNEANKRFECVQKVLSCQLRSLLIVESCCLTPCHIPDCWIPFLALLLANSVIPWIRYLNSTAPSVPCAKGRMGRVPY